MILAALSMRSTLSLLSLLGCYSRSVHRALARLLDLTIHDESIRMAPGSLSRPDARAACSGFVGVHRRCQVRLDFGFLVVYPLFLSLACLLLADRLSAGWTVIGAFLSWTVLLAGPADAVENLALLRMIRGSATDGSAAVTSWLAGLKWILVFCGLGYLLLGGVNARWIRLHGGS